MKDVENVTGRIVESEAVTPAEEAGNTAAGDAAGLGEDAHADPDVGPDAGPDAGLDAGTGAAAIAPVDGAGPSPRAADPGPWQALVQVGAQFVAALAAAKDPGAPAHPWIERNPATGAQSLRMPLPPPETARQLAAALSALADTLRGGMA
jgi:hypothetical protein